MESGVPSSTRIKPHVTSVDILHLTHTATAALDSFPVQGGKKKKQHRDLRVHDSGYHPPSARQCYPAPFIRLNIDVISILYILVPPVVRGLCARPSLLLLPALPRAHLHQNPDWERASINADSGPLPFPCSIFSFLSWTVVGSIYTIYTARPSPASQDHTSTYHHHCLASSPAAPDAHSIHPIHSAPIRVHYNAISTPHLDWPDPVSGNSPTTKRRLRRAFCLCPFIRRDNETEKDTPP